jgi:purine nucleoside permease
MNVSRQLILLGVVLLFGIGAVLYARVINPAASGNTAELAPKILTVTAFQTGDPLKNDFGAATAWVQNDQLTRTFEIPGLEYPLYCNAEGSHCLAILGVGSPNAAVSMTALALSDKIDLSKTYIMFSGIAGTPPAQGTLGAVAWATHLVSANTIGELDAREMPKDWQYPKVQLDCATPTCSSNFRTGVELYALNPTLTQWAYRLSKEVALMDNAKAQNFRALYPQNVPAQRAPFVLEPCAFLSDSTFWHGKLLSDWATWWVKYWTQGKSPYCMVAFEETPMLTALTRLAKTGRVDLNRVMVQRGASNFDQQHAGQTAQESFQLALDSASGGGPIALENLYRAGSVVNTYILEHWSEWEKGVPNLP